MHAAWLRVGGWVSWEVFFSQLASRVRLLAFRWTVQLRPESCRGMASDPAPAVPAPAAVQVPLMSPSNQPVQAAPAAQASADSLDQQRIELKQLLTSLSSSSTLHKKETLLNF